jgi:septum formation protein
MGKNQSLTPYPLILASTSKYRRALLQQLGWEFTCESPQIEEDDFKSLGLSPADLAAKLAYLKAEAVFSRHSDAVVIGSDQVCCLENRILGKPGTKEKALEQLLSLRGRSHELLTAVTIFSPEKVVSFINRTNLTMRYLSEEALKSYVERDLPLDCAGSYKLESLGIKLFEGIQMDDHTSVIGLPLIQLSHHLLELGYPF